MTILLRERERGRERGRENGLAWQGGSAFVQMRKRGCRSGKYT